MTKTDLIISLLGYALLIFILILLPFHLYTPTRNFDLPHLLWLIHLLLLYIHEAGHLFFSVFGRTMSILGGSLNQILVPIIWYVVAKREGSSLSNVAIFFTGVSIVDVSIYVKDAEVTLLPLIGGLSVAHHDWRNLLRGWDMLEYGYTFGEIVFWIGIFLCVFGIYRGITSSITRYRNALLSV